MRSSWLVGVVVSMARIRCCKNSLAISSPTTSLVVTDVVLRCVSSTIIEPPVDPEAALATAARQGRRSLSVCHMLTMYNNWCRGGISQ